MPTLGKQIENSPNVETLIRGALERIKQGIEKNMSSKGRNASRYSVGSLRIETTGVGGTLYGSRSFKFMEYGRGAGKVPRNFKVIIKQWMRDKGFGLHGKSEENVAYAIANNIRSKGTTLHQKKGFDDIFTTMINAEMSRLSTEILTEVTSSVQYITEQFAKTK